MLSMFFNWFINYSLNYLCHLYTKFFILDKVFKNLALVPRGDCPPEVTPHLDSPPIAITNWLGYSDQISPISI